jgi:enoyl-CoA hydratase
MASTLTLPRAIGTARALELFYTGRIVSGREAEAMGLVSRAVPRAELLPTALETARTIAGSSPLVVRMLKRAVYQGMESAVAAAVEYEAFCQAITFGSEDLQEGLLAARERRAPRFRGR